MTIQVPFHLRRKSVTEPAVALLVPSRAPRVVLEFCSRLGLDPSGRIFDVAEGFLLELERPATGPIPGAVRLRAVARALYVPVDAELVPSLLDDEASGMVRDWGLVFRPAGPALLFDRHAPVELNELVRAEPRPRRGWNSFPVPRPLADRLAEIAFERPDQPPEELYRDFKQEIGREPARAGPAEDCDKPDDMTDAERSGRRPSEGADADATQGGHSMPNQAGGPTFGLGTVVYGVMALFARAGQTLSGLKDKAQWEWVDHSHLLRQLLREFRDGDPAKALRRAMPITRPDEPAVPTRLAKLPWARAIYNLGDLLRPRHPGRGEVNSVLPAEPNLMYVLAQEYRKAAQRAAELGDFRRAAYIHGFLLRDDRQAAGALQRGGLHHDAAILYMKKLNDLTAAAQAFEAAGEVDRAIALYRQMARHEAAGDLLSRIGDEEAASVEYAAAAALLSDSSPPDHLAAGRLWLQKGRNPDRAIEQFRNGWARRPEENAALCALELARLHAGRGTLGPIMTLLDEADALFDSPGQPYNGFFYNEVTRLASLPGMEPRAEDLRDRVLESMVRKLRQGVESGQSAPGLVSALLGKSKLWPAPLVSDAEFAASAESKRPRARASAGRRDPLMTGTQINGIVTAACHASVTGEVFLGLACGRVLCFRAERDQVVTIAENDQPVIGLTVDPDGRTLVALCQTGEMGVLSCFVRIPDGRFRRRPDVYLSRGSDFWLTPIVSWGVMQLVGVGEGRELRIIDAPSGMLWQEVTIAGETPALPATAILLLTGSSMNASESRLVVLTHEGPSWVACDLNGTRRTPAPFRWQPGIPGSSTLRSVSISSRFVPPCLDLLGLDASGAVHAAQFHAEDGSLDLVEERVAFTPGGYLAAARAGTNGVVAIASKRIDWLDASAERFSVLQTVDVGLQSAVACFNSPSTREVVVVCADGYIARVVTPRRSRAILG
jgi:tetratricopeptide (TPR) repeat protein